MAGPRLPGALGSRTAQPPACWAGACSGRGRGKGHAGVHWTVRAKRPKPRRTCRGSLRRAGLGANPEDMLPRFRRRRKRQASRAKGKRSVPVTTKMEGVRAAAWPPARQRDPERHCNLRRRQDAKALFGRSACRDIPEQHRATARRRMGGDRFPDTRSRGGTVRPPEFGPDAAGSCFPALSCS